MAIELDKPVPAIALCAIGHVACVQVVDSYGRTWCWGWHLVAWDPDWAAYVSDVRQVRECIDRLTVDLVGGGVNAAACTWTGRIGE